MPHLSRFAAQFEIGIERRNAGSLALNEHQNAFRGDFDQTAAKVSTMLRRTVTDVKAALHNYLSDYGKDDTAVLKIGEIMVKVAK